MSVFTLLVTEVDAGLWHVVWLIRIFTLIELGEVHPTDTDGANLSERNR